MKRISDLTLSAYLIIQKHKLRGMENDGSRSLFVFEDTPQLKKNILAFYNRQTSVDALTFGESIRNLKALAISERRG